MKVQSNSFDLVSFQDDFCQGQGGDFLARDACMASCLYFRHSVLKLFLFHVSSI